MKALRLSGIPKRKKRVTTTVMGTEDKFASNALNRESSVDQPNQAWVADITDLATDAGWVYLSVLIDLHSMREVGWAIADHMETQLCLDALQQAVALRQPAPGLRHHSDRGTQYSSHAYQAALTALQARPSMSREGNCWDNAVAESFFGTLEQELVRQSAGWTGLAESRLAESRLAVAGAAAANLENIVNINVLSGPRGALEFAKQIGPSKQGKVTSMDGVPEELWRFYNGRADCERVFRTARQALGMGKLVGQVFRANETAFMLRLLAMNADLRFQADREARAERAPDAKSAPRQGLIRRQRSFYRTPGRLLKSQGRWRLRVPDRPSLAELWRHYAPGRVALE